ncbi:MAG: hypothetical protein WC402_03445 [Candidatus Pacearchaeota archaeon]|jgi:flagellar basal body-associated protein FliL
MEKKTLIIILAVIILVLVAGGLYLYFSKNKSNPNPSKGFPPNMNDSGRPNRNNSFTGDSPMRNESERRMPPNGSMPPGNGSIKLPNREMGGNPL